MNNNNNTSKILSKDSQGQREPVLTPAQANLIKLSVDVHKLSYLVVRQIDNANPQPGQRMKPQDFIDWAKKQKLLAHRVVVCYEAGPFGFTLARRLEELGIECLVMCPQNLDERHKRVNTDRTDARAIAVRLDRYLAGSKDALALCFIPTVEQEMERGEGRQRGQLLKSRKRLEAQGLGLLRSLDLEPEASGAWWEEPIWSVMSKKWPSAVVERLERFRRPLLVLEQEIQSLTVKIAMAVEKHLPATMPTLPKGIGGLSYELIRRELIDWKRFKNRGQMSSISGLCPSESSSGQSRRQGPISKHGNPHIRVLLVEMAWRMLHFQPEYEPVVYWRERVFDDLKATRARRKQAVVGLARRLGIDLWRLATGQTTPERLGLMMPVGKTYVLKGCKMAS
jgi:transposase